MRIKKLLTTMKRATPFAFAATGLIALVAFTMLIIVHQLADISQPVQTTLFVQNVLALVILVSIAAFLMRMGFAERERDLRPAVNLFDIAMFAMMVVLFAALVIVYLILNGASFDRIMSGVLARLGAWYALATIAGATIYFFLSHREALLLSAADQAEQETRHNAVIAELNKKLAAHEASVEHGVDTIMVKSAGRIDYALVNEITHIVSARNYVELHGLEKTYLYRQSLRVLLQRLEKKGFLQIHRGAAVNLIHIREYVRDGAKSTVRLSEGAVLSVGPAFRERLLERLEAMVKADVSPLHPQNSHALSQTT
ncbi:MAG: hypothetical protein DHS20C05_14180 [Hyphococcus sp.]|nr:MAG: hypothetical protein DHS20C05_14180 [Marinicaulis sp.]